MTGYGHIAPKTYMGKISTIFYAILGIPLMLLCLSNIGDIMASSFRYNTNMEDPYYPDNDRGMRQQGNLMPPSKYDAQGSGGMRQKMRGPPNPEVFMTDDYPSGHQQMIRSPPQSRADSMRLETHPQRSVQKPRQNDALYRKSPVLSHYKFPGTRAQSLDRRAFRQDSHMIDMDDESPCKTPILCNKYAIDDVDEIGRQTRPNPRSQSMPRQARYGDSLMPDRMPYYTEDNELADMQTVRKSAPRRREPRPVHRQARHLQNVMDDNSIYDDEWDMHSGELPPPSIVRPVPIWLCVFLVVSYIIAGAFMFSEWEEWSFLDSAYFCFITLTTIGFGDFVPAQGVKNDSEISIALCSLYLLFGIALLAMSFNLVQEESIPPDLADCDRFVTIYGNEHSLSIVIIIIITTIQWCGCRQMTLLLPPRGHSYQCL
uniref:Potassium channel domain-containing protein n=1 Tax=Anopheles atroparvus TaxID=41427 RepID=A0A182JH82_ANOAO